MARRKTKDEGAASAAPDTNAKGDAVTEDAKLRTRVEVLEAKVDRLLGIVAKGETYDLPSYRSAVKEGRRLFVVAADCQHPALRIRKGADMRIVDYNQGLVEDLIGKGLLKLLKAA